jgi:hypothetical protein
MASGKGTAHGQCRRARLLTVRERHLNLPHCNAPLSPPSPSLPPPDNISLPAGEGRQRGRSDGGPDYTAPSRNLALELVRVTEAAALASAKWCGALLAYSGEGAAQFWSLRVLGSSPAPICGPCARFCCPPLRCRFLRRLFGEVRTGAARCDLRARPASTSANTTSP